MHTMNVMNGELEGEQCRGKSLGSIIKIDYLISCRQSQRIVHVFMIVHGIDRVVTFGLPKRLCWVGLKTR